MPRLVSALLCTAFITLGLSACAEPAHQKRPPQDPPDYKGVPTDMTPPSMIAPSTKPQ
ncbi:lipoprotein [Caballeronia cordobensis]|uniref:Lipoprotein n=1 Tax=Caballeronia cordobensis TaxID=1353886 RepID=A0A158IJR7_CABCO|nr:hypothetical protein [Caballeronia cordobensis]SAL56826.1 lipoprotein [Caballeronia cordobensis]